MLETVEDNSSPSNRVRKSSQDDADRVSEEAPIDADDDENDAVHRDDRNNHRDWYSSTSCFPRNWTLVSRRRNSSKVDNRWNCHYCSFSGCSRRLHRVQLRRDDWLNYPFLIGTSIGEHRRHCCSSREPRSVGWQRLAADAVEVVESTFGCLSRNEQLAAVWVLRHLRISPPGQDDVAVVSHQGQRSTNHCSHRSSRRDWWSTRKICPSLHFGHVWIDCVTRDCAEWSSTKEDSARSRLKTKENGSLPSSLHYCSGRLYSWRRAHI